MADPAVVLIWLFISFNKFALGPITHRVKSDLAFHQGTDRLVPTQRRMVRIEVILHFCEITHRLFYLRIIPFHLATEQVGPSLWPDNTQQRVFKELRRGPNP